MPAISPITLREAALPKGLTTWNFALRAAFLGRPTADFRVICGRAPRLLYLPKNSLFNFFCVAVKLFGF